MKCLCMHAEAMKNSKFFFTNIPFNEIMTFYKFDLNDIQRFPKKLHTSNYIPTIVGDTAPPAGCSQYLTGTSGSFYRFFKYISVSSKPAAFQRMFFILLVLIFPLQSQLWREPAPCGLGLQVIFHHCQRHYVKHQHQQNHLT